MEVSGNGENQGLIRFVRDRRLDIPVFILVGRHLFEEIPPAVLGRVTGHVFIDEDTPEFVTRNLVSHLLRYTGSLKTPFFGAMVDNAPLQLRNRRIITVVQGRYEKGGNNAV